MGFKHEKVMEKPHLAGESLFAVNVGNVNCGWLKNSLMNVAFNGKIIEQND